MPAIHLKPELEAQLARAAEATGQSPERFLETAVLEYLKELKSELGEWPDSLGKVSESAPVPDAEKTLLDARWAQHLGNPGGALDIDEVKRRLAQAK